MNTNDTKTKDDELPLVLPQENEIWVLKLAEFIEDDRFVIIRSTILRKLNGIPEVRYNSLNNKTGAIDRDLKSMEISNFYYAYRKKTEALDWPGRQVILPKFNTWTNADRMADWRTPQEISEALDKHFDGLKPRLLQLKKELKIMEQDFKKYQQFSRVL